jgi:hypothetical protein
LESAANALGVRLLSVERRAANYQDPTRHHVRDGVFEDHYKTFQFPTADEPVLRIVEGFDLQTWLTEEAAQR